jgi:hypothetical protein
MRPSIGLELDVMETDAWVEYPTFQVPASPMLTFNWTESAKLLEADSTP